MARKLGVWLICLGAWSCRNDFGEPWQGFGEQTHATHESRSAPRPQAPARAAAAPGQRARRDAGNEHMKALDAAADSGGMRPLDPPRDAATADATASDASDPGVPPEVARYADDWPLPNVDYQNTRNPTTAITGRNITQLREAWRFRLQGGVTTFGYYTANTLILGDVVYLQDMMSNIYALSRATGEVLWTHLFNAETFGPNGVAIGWGKLFAAVGDSRVVALQLDGGAEVWSFAPMLGSSMGIDIQPIVYGKQLYAATVPVSTSRGIYGGGTHGLLLALDAETGAQRWSFDTIDSPDAWGDPEANGGGGAWYPPLIDPQRGLSYWGTGNPVPWPGTATQPNGGSRPGPNLYTSSVVAVGVGDGKLAWHYQDQPHDIFDWDFQVTPVLVRAAAQSGGDVIIGAGKTGAVVALDANTGERLWRTKVGKHENDELSEFPAQSITIYPGVLGGVMSALAYADGVVYAASVDAGMSYDGNLLLPEISGTGALTAIDVRDGRVLWTAALRGAGYASATLANDLVLTADETGRVYAFARATGEEVWHYDAPAGINAPLVVAGDDLLIGVGMDLGVVIALSLRAPAGDSGTAGAAGAVAPPTAGNAAEPPSEPTWSAVYASIVERGCNGGTTCHSSMLAGQLRMSSAAEAYSALVSVPAMGSGGSAPCQVTGLLRVAPNDPDRSLLVQKLEAAMPVCGQHMPPGGMVPAAQLALLRAWIEKGAPND